MRRLSTVPACLERPPLETPRWTHERPSSISGGINRVPLAELPLLGTQGRAELCPQPRGCRDRLCRLPLLAGQLVRGRARVAPALGKWRISLGIEGARHEAAKTRKLLSAGTCVTGASSMHASPLGSTNARGVGPPRHQLFPKSRFGSQVTGSASTWPAPGPWANRPCSRNSASRPAETRPTLRPNGTRTSGMGTGRKHALLGSLQLPIAVQCTRWVFEQLRNHHAPLGSLLQRACPKCDLR